MGLDITLAKIESSEIKDNCWLLVSECPELKEMFSSFAVQKHFQYTDESYIEEVYYYSEISYQRKGVTRDFYKNLENDKCLVTREELEQVWAFVAIEMKESLQVNFMDKFVPGQTFVIISW